MAVVEPITTSSMAESDRTETMMGQNYAHLTQRCRMWQAPHPERRHISLRSKTACRRSVSPSLPTRTTALTETTSTESVAPTLADNHDSKQLSHCWAYTIKQQYDTEVMS